MDTIRSIGSTIETFFSTLWDGFIDLYASSPWLVLGAAITLIAIMVGLWALLRRTRDTRRGRVEPAKGATASHVRTTIRRPVYVDPLLLDDLLAHVETRDYSRSLRDTLEGGQLEEEGHTAETRKLNKVLAGFTGRTDLVANLDERSDAELESGRAVIVTGTLTELPATAAAELLELSAPLLTHTPSENGDHGSLKTRVRPATTGDGTQAPLVLRLRPDDDDRSLLLVLPRDGLRVDDPDTLGGRVTLLGVVDDVLGSRDRLGPGDYLAPGLSSEVREQLRDRDLGDLVGSLAQAAGTKLAERDLVFKGPGARVTAAAIYR